VALLFGRILPVFFLLAPGRTGASTPSVLAGVYEMGSSLLMMSLVGFLPPEDVRIAGTVAAIERELIVDGFVRRYETSQAGEVDGLPAGEGVFLPCTFWLAHNYVLPCVLAINGGSSSIRFAVYEARETPLRRLDGTIDRIGLRGTNLIVHDPAGTPPVARRLAAADHRTAVAFLLEWLERQPIFASVKGEVKGAGHRVVHGMAHSQPERVTPKLLAELHRITPYAPDHLPREIALIKAFSQRHPTLPQVACFDTSFHRTLPRVAHVAADPEALRAQGRRTLRFPRSVLRLFDGGTRPPRSRGHGGARDPRASRQRRQSGRRA
jgi:hypothetical protein